MADVSPLSGIISDVQTSNPIMGEFLSFLFSRVLKHRLSAAPESSGITLRIPRKPQVSGFRRLSRRFGDLFMSGARTSMGHNAEF